MAPIPPTVHGIRKLLSRELASANTTSSDLIVAVFPNNGSSRNNNSNSNGAFLWQTCVASDGRDYTPALLLCHGGAFAAKTSSKLWPGNAIATTLMNKPFVLQISTFLVSKANMSLPHNNHGTAPPPPNNTINNEYLLFITAGCILQTHCRNVRRPPTPGAATFRPYTLPSSTTSGSTSSSGSGPNANNTSNNNTSGLRIPGGVAPSFLSTWAPILRNEALAGVVTDRSTATTTAASSRNDSTKLQHATALAQFLAHHQAICTLHSSSSASPRHDGNNNTGTTTTSTTTTTMDTLLNGSAANLEQYMSALKEFQTSQLDRQKASLASHSGREDARRAALVESQYMQALRAALGLDNGTADTTATPPTQALQPTSSLTRQTLLQWHAILCGGGVHAEAGVLRQKQVRVGPVHFGPHEKVPEELDRLCHHLRALEERLLPKHPPAASSSQDEPSSSSSSLLTPEARRGLQIATFGAAVFFGLVDIHGFCDGNGRLARVALNWALQKAGVPFCIHLFANPRQRLEYTTAIRRTRRNLSLVAVHCHNHNNNATTTKTSLDHDNAALLHAFEHAGALGPLVDLILDRLAKAVSELDAAVREKSQAAAEQGQWQAAKAFRERERLRGTCLICLDANPNIATLCCGKAVHLNCVAEWIAVSSATCPNCRQAFPALLPPQRLQRRPAANADDDDDEDDEMLHPHPEDYDDEDDFTTTDDLDDEDDSTTSSGVDIVVTVPSGARVQEYVNDTTSSTTTMDVDHVAASNRNAGPDDDDDDTWSTTDIAAGMAVHPSAAADDDDEDDTCSTTTDVVANHHQQQQQQQQVDVDDTTDDTTTADDAAESSTTTAAAAAAAQNHLPPTCNVAGCRNRAARDCQNGCCGRCCVMHGYYECARHMSFAP